MHFMLSFVTIEIVYIYYISMDTEKNTIGEPWNIFDEFSIDESLKKEIAESDKSVHKDIFFYISKVNILLTFLNISLLLIVVVLFWYIFVQKSEEPWIFSFLEPLCSVFVWRSDIYNSWCSSVTYSVSQYSESISQLESSQASRLGPLVWDVYSLEDFFSSRRVNFILDSSISRLRPLEILEEFDKMQAQFTPIDKLEVYCPTITMQSDLTLELTCISHSSDWDSTLSQLDEWILRQTSDRGGTSISKAANFINFLENAPGSKFRVIERPTTFISEDTQFGQYTKRTNFRLILQYQSEALIY